ncbi:MAG TPA: hypothetical protein VLF94_07335 [Chlamydiales bacterium]|nr:hypothetical protein [Chlamydiales bacterium]
MATAAEMLSNQRPFSLVHPDSRPPGPLLSGKLDQLARISQCARGRGVMLPPLREPDAHKILKDIMQRAHPEFLNKPYDWSWLLILEEKEIAEAKEIFRNQKQFNRCLQELEHRFDRSRLAVIS